MFVTSKVLNLSIQLLHWHLSSLLDSKLCENRFCVSLFSSWKPPYLVHCLALSRNSRNIHWMAKMNELWVLYLEELKFRYWKESLLWLLIWQKFKLKLRTITSSKSVILYHYLIFVKTKSKTIVSLTCNMLEKWYVIKTKWRNF